ncbi:HAMP domain-containing sensor histidine kinase [Nonomuraea sp. NPDC049758]|uniref:sensor histidine kinase n=1 Tax=Nonomuraea sp. NPDC049758 TaxID=3154360 RepID=UPI00343C12E4
MFRRWSVQRRLTLAALLCALAGYGVTALLVTPLVHTLATGFLTEQTAGAARRIAFVVERDAPGRLRPVAVTEGTDLIQVVDADGRIRQASPRLTGQPPLSTATATGTDARLDTTSCTDRLRGVHCLITVGFRAHVGGRPWMIYAYTPELPWYISPWYPPVTGLGVLLLAAVTACVAWLTARKALTPVSAIKDELAEITATDLGRRVPRGRHRDELDDLARTVNETLDRLEHAVEQQRRFASDASHDLRSPIAAMRTQVEEAMLAPEETDWPRTGRRVIEGLDRLQNIVGDLLTLARLEAGAPGRREPVDLARLVREELLRRPERRLVETRLRSGVVVAGDALRLSRLLANLLDNAERHADTMITVTVGEQEGRAVLEVLDDGAGIAPDQREAVFRRFTRLADSRRRDAGGTGLGLPIAREIAENHEGTLTIEPSERGARFVLQIPLISS